MGRTDILPFWFGEPYQPTPEVIRAAGVRSIEAGDTFYSPNLGIPELRAAIAGYQTKVHRRGNEKTPIEATQVAVTSSGVNALMLAAQLLVEPLDHVVAITPLWPNLVEIPRILGARVTTVAVNLISGQWQLDMNRVYDELDSKTKVLMVNSPNNPTGWVMPAHQIQELLEVCRKKGIWLISDEAYNRLYFRQDRGSTTHAPSFLDYASTEERLIVANTFSKTWQMTGWRLGWLNCPVSLMDDLSKLIEFNTSCAPIFVQKAGIAAIDQGDWIIENFRLELSVAANLMQRRLQALPGITLGAIDGAMYAFFKIDADSDSLALAKRLVSEFGLGLAPGVAFGEESEGYLRWCIAKPPNVLEDGLARFESALKSIRQHNSIG